MKILVVSDSHGRYSTLNKIIRNQPSAEVVLFLGDGVEEFEDLKLEYPEKMFIGVKGNNDFFCKLPISEERTVEGKKIYMTHGHSCGVKHGLEMLKAEGRKCGADIVLYGHTHISDIEYDDGMYIMNPGAAYYQSYGVIDIQNGDILVNTAEYKEN